MVVLAMYTLMFFHPARLLKKMGQKKLASGSSIQLMHKDAEYPDPV